MNSREFQDRLGRRARRAGVALPATLANNLESYFRVLAAWNEKINLAGMDLSDPTPEALDRLLVEPLLAARRVRRGAKRMIDIGSGGGSPAIPLVLAIPDLKLSLVEAKTRKSVFLREVIRVLQLGGAQVEVTRYEALLTRQEFREAYDLLTVRAVRLAPSILMDLQTFLRPAGQMFLFRSVTAEALPTQMPSLTFVAAQFLTDSRSQLLVLEKRHGTD